MADTATNASAGQRATQPATSTILENITALLQSHLAQHPRPSLPHLHPYAPASSSSVRYPLLSIQEQVETLQRLKAGIEETRNVLARVSPSEERERLRMVRALREVTSHQSALLPASTALTSLSLPSTSSSTSPASAPLIPSARIYLSPVNLLTTLAKAQGIETYLEDSQFGLLKTSLAIAGNRFVVDVDLETDASEGREDDDDGDDEEPRAGPSAATAAAPVEGRGKVRLSRLTANHVNTDGGTGKSAWVEEVLRDRFQRYLVEWNGEPAAGKERRLEEMVRQLEREMAELKELDRLAEQQEGQGKEWFKDLEELAGWIKTVPGVVVSDSSIFPTLRLLDSTSAANTRFRIRPSRQGETVPAPFEAPSTTPWLAGAWVIECEGDGGLVVRRDWLNLTGTSTEMAEQDEWNTAIKVEQLLCCAGQQDVTPFPYTSDFVHHPQPVKGGTNSLEQRWSIAQPGPEGFIIGRLGVPATKDLVLRTLQVLRRQVVLNELFISVFHRDSLDTPNGGNGDGSDSDSDFDMEDILSAPPRAIPLTASLSTGAITVSFPLPSSGETGAGSDVAICVSPRQEGPDHVQVELVTASDEARTKLAGWVATAGGRDVAEIVRNLLGAL